MNVLIFKIYTAVPCSSSGCLSGITWKSFLIVCRKSAAGLRLKHEGRPIEFGMVETEGRGNIGGRRNKRIQTEQISGMSKLRWLFASSFCSESLDSFTCSLTASGL